MIYQNFQTYTDFAGPLRASADLTAAALMRGLPGISPNPSVRAIAAICELIARAGLSHRRPAFGIDSVRIKGRLVAVREMAVRQTPFCTLLHLEKDYGSVQPRVLLVAPMSGHFATLLRGPAETLPGPAGGILPANGENCFSGARPAPRQIRYSSPLL